MSDGKPANVAGTDWTRLLSDPEMVRHVGKLLKAYREAPAEKREEALLAAMREIRAETYASGKIPVSPSPSTQPQPMPIPQAAIPPFQPDIFTPNPGDDRRRHPRIKCFVAVELRVDGSDKPVWGNLSNTSLGGCLVETASPIHNGAQVEIGLWVANGKIWIKGFALSGVVIRSAPTVGVRVRFDAMESAERDNLRQFLKFVQETSRALRSEGNYLQMLK